MARLQLKHNVCLHSTQMLLACLRNLIRDQLASESNRLPFTGYESMTAAITMKLVDRVSDTGREAVRADGSTGVAS